MSCDWEGNRRSGVALAVCHRLGVIFICTLSSIRKSTEDAASLLYGVRMAFFTVRVKAGVLYEYVACF